MRSVVVVAILGLLAGLAPAAAADKEFAGSEACKRCHAKQYDTWKSSLHAKMVRSKEEGILKAVVENWASDGAIPGPAKGNVDGKPHSLDEVVFVVGSNWKQRFLVKNEATGNHQFLDKQWNRMSGKWEPYGQKNDWETVCATCHTTGYRLLSYDASRPQEQKHSYSEKAVGCEACHGPGAQHVKAPSKKTIYSFAGKSVEQQTLVCGYCHIRGENDRFKTAQGNPSEYLPSPKLGETFRPGDDWRTWYATDAIIPGVHPEDPIDKAYGGDLKGLFRVDEVAKAGSFYDSGKHHQQYQEYIQSQHYKKNVASCSTCHSSHAAKDGKVKDTKKICASCHDATYTVEKFMPGSGSTAAGLTIRTHTFNKAQTRATVGVVASGEPVLYKK